MCVYVAQLIYREIFVVWWLFPRLLCENFSANNLCDWQMTKKWKVKRLEDFRIRTDRRGTKRKKEKTINRADILLLHTGSLPRALSSEMGAGWALKIVSGLFQCIRVFLCVCVCVCRTCLRVCVSELWTLRHSILMYYYLHLGIELATCHTDENFVRLTAAGCKHTHKPTSTKHTHTLTQIEN